MYTCTYMYIVQMEYVYLCFDKGKRVLTKSKRLILNSNNYFQYHTIKRKQFDVITNTNA